MVRDNVKIDAEILKKVIAITKDKTKRIKYATAKQFVDIAVMELLEKEGKK